VTIVSEMATTPATRRDDPALRSGGKIPRLAGFPLLGRPYRVLSHPGRYILDGYRRHGPVFRFRLFGLDLVAMVGPEANHFILIGERARFSHAYGYRTMTRVFGDGLLLQDGDVHRRNRQLMTPAFHQQGVRRYLEVMHECARAHVTRWASEPAAPMHRRFQRLTFEIMARLILGMRGELEMERFGRLNTLLGRATTAFPKLDLPFTAFARGLRGRDELRAKLRAVVRTRRDDPGTDALGLLLSARDEQGDALSEDELVDQAIFLMFAGHETTTSMLTSLLIALAEHPDTYHRLVAEQREVVGEDDLTVDHLKRMQVLDLVLKEVERLWPPVSMTTRGVAEDVVFDGHLLPAGTTVVYSPWATHRLPQVFADPERFDPDRFAPPRSEHKATPCALVGFGAGPRLCIGQAFSLMESKVVASELLRHCRWQVDTRRLRLRYVPTLHPVCGLPARVERQRPLA
jgi:cytochrome P450